MPQPVTECVDMLQALFHNKTLLANIAADLATLDGDPEAFAGLSAKGQKNWLKTTQQLQLAKARLKDGNYEVTVPFTAMGEAAQIEFGQTVAEDEERDNLLSLFVTDQTTISPTADLEFQLLTRSWSDKLPKAYGALRGEWSHAEVLEQVAMPLPSDPDAFFEHLERKYGPYADGALHHLSSRIENLIVTPANANKPEAVFLTNAFYVLAGREFVGDGDYTAGTNVVLSLPAALRNGITTHSEDAAYKAVDKSLTVLAHRVVLRLFCLVANHQDRSASGSVTPTFDDVRKKCVIPGLAAPTEIAYGACVKLHGLTTSESEVNMDGWRGIVYGKTLDKNGKWMVSLDAIYKDDTLSYTDRVVKSIKLFDPANLKVCGMSFLAFIPGVRVWQKTLSPMLLFSQSDAVTLLGSKSKPRLLNMGYPGHAMFWSSAVADSGASAGPQVTVTAHDPNVTSLQMLECYLRKPNAVKHSPGGWCATWATFEAECSVSGATTLHRALKEDAFQVLQGHDVAADRPLSRMMAIFEVSDPRTALTELVCRLWLRRLDMYTRCWQLYPAYEAEERRRVLADFSDSDDDDDDDDAAEELSKSAALVQAFKEFIFSADASHIAGYYSNTGVLMATAATDRCTA